MKIAELLNRVGLIGFLSSLFFLSSAIITAEPISLSLSLGTSELMPAATSYQFEFDLFGVAGNSVTISNPTFTGGGSLAGGQPAALTLTDSISNPFVSDFWRFTPGSSVSFSLSSTDVPPGSGVGPDGALIFLEDLSGTPLPTTDPFGQDVLLRLALTGGSDVPQLFLGSTPPFTTGFTTGGATGSTGGTGSSSGVDSPEPGTLPSFAIGGLVLAALDSLRRIRRGAYKARRAV